MQNLYLNTKNLDVRECEIKKILYKNDLVLGVIDEKGIIIKSKILIVSIGTYMDACIYRGVKKELIGTDREKASNGFSDSLKEGFKTYSFKNGYASKIKKRKYKFFKNRNCLWYNIKIMLFLIQQKNF